MAESTSAETSKVFTDEHFAVATRNDARALWDASGLTYDVLTQDNLRRLIAFLDEAMTESGAILGTFRMWHKLGLRRRNGKPTEAALRCKSCSFADREAVSFNAGGFVGLAGWADDENIKPVLAGFARWVSSLHAPDGETARG